MRLTLIFFTFLATNLQAADTLSVAQCRQLAEQNSPLQQKKALAENIAALQTRNLQSNNLPRISVGAQATWQSDVFGFPVESPLFNVPKVPKDQYKLSVDASQRIWDGNSDRFMRRQSDLERELAATQTDVDVFQIRELVTDLYFKILLLQESIAILQASQADLESRLKQAEAGIKEGIALKTTADQVRINILKTEQQLGSTHADQTTLMKILALWIGRERVDFALTMPANTVSVPTGPAERPEYRLFLLQQQNLQLGRDMLRLKSQPRVDAFVQGGVGRPNPFNFFETGFEPFFLVGLRAAWTPIDWGNRSRDAQVLELQAKNIDAQRAAFDLRLEASLVKDREDSGKSKALLQQDDAIIKLQEDIVRRAEAQVREGVMTATDYLTQLNILTQARLTRATHEVQDMQAKEMLNSKR